jgi:thymidylate synthase (FAD)
MENEVEKSKTYQRGYDETFCHYVGGAQIECMYDRGWLAAINEAEESYMLFVKDGWSPQEARSVFPNALASKLIMTGNLRSWRHFLRMRSTKETHPQMRQVVDPLLDQFKRAVPILFDDITAGNRQIDNLKLPC